MVQALVVRVRVDVAQHLTVDRRVAQPDHDLRLQMVLALVVAVERILQYLWHTIVVRFREQPPD